MKKIILIWDHLVIIQKTILLPKIVMDAISTIQCIGQDFVTEVLKMPTGVINSGLKSAYLSGVPTSMNYETTNVENDFSNEDSFALIDLDCNNESIEMVVLGDIAPAHSHRNNLIKSILKNSYTLRN